MDVTKFQGADNPRGKPRGKGIAHYLAQVAEQPIDPSRPYITKKMVIAEKLFEIAVAEKSSNKDRMQAIEMIMDRLDGKAVATTVTAELEASPLSDIDTPALEALRAKLLANKRCEDIGKPKVEIECKPS